MSICHKSHRYAAGFASLPEDQGGIGRHKCAGCAYEQGYQDGFHRKEQLDLVLESLPDSQAGTVRHRSPHAAYELGYQDGTKAS
jgi:hypothetical protein